VAESLMNLPASDAIRLILAISAEMLSGKRAFAGQFLRGGDAREFGGRAPSKFVGAGVCVTVATTNDRMPGYSRVWSPIPHNTDGATTTVVTKPLILAGRKNPWLTKSAGQHVE
jgi:hypothetical protein